MCSGLAAIFTYWSPYLRNGRPSLATLQLHLVLATSYLLHPIMRLRGYWACLINE